jgi:hypothetical protein
MERRTFLFRAGIIAPAVVLSPSSVWASSTATQAYALFIAGNDRNSTTVAGIVSDAGNSVKQLQAADIAEISYTRSGFSVRLKNGAVHSSSKIIVHSAYQVAIDRLTVTVATGDDEQLLPCCSGRNKDKPEFWAYAAKTFDAQQMQWFLERKKPAFMCVS